MGSRRFLLGVGRLTAVVFGLSLCSLASAEEVVSPSPSAASTSQGEDAFPACPASLRLRAVQFDPNHDERSFIVLSGSSLRAPPLRQGSRVGAYAIEHIERGGAVLAAQAHRCSLRLRGAQVEHALRTVSVADVRSGLRARSAAAAPTAVERSKLVAAR